VATEKTAQLDCKSLRRWGGVSDYLMMVSIFRLMTDELERI
jgi:hypothetical protein